MSLFPIAAGKSAVERDGAGERTQDPAAWLSNNASFRPQEVLQPQPAYGNYATQADFLRAAERYLETSSDDETDEVGAAKPTAQRKIGGDAAGIGNTSTLPNKAQPHRKGSSRGRSPSPSRSISSSDSSDTSGRRRHKSKRRASRSPKHSRKRKKHKHRSDSRDRDEQERQKILRLERAAAAAGLTPSQAAALTATRPILKGAGSTPSDFYYDTRGDMQNLIYEGLYGGHVVSYHRTDALGLAKGARARRLLPGQIAPSWALADDQSKADAETAALASRYFSGRAVALERSRRLRRVYLSEAPVLPGSSAANANGGRSRFGSAAGGVGDIPGLTSQPHQEVRRRGWLLSQLEGPAAGVSAASRSAGGGAWGSGGGSSGYKMPLPLPSFLPLEDVPPGAAAAGEGTGGGVGGGVVARGMAAVAAAAATSGETTEEWVLRHTREFNIAVREAPESVPLWLRFAAFQDTVARLLSNRRTGDVSGAEKKLAILQRALDAHPGNPRLIRAMMVASEPLMDPEALMDRWERLLRRTPGHPSLWRDYLTLRRSLFSAVKLSGLQMAYGNAMHALASERARLQREAATTAVSAGSSEFHRLRHAVSDLDEQAVRMLLELIELELGAGTSEVAVARLQAVTEFHCCAPGSIDQGVAAGSGAGGFGSQSAGGGGGGGGATGGLRLSAGALLRLFDNFWESGAPRLGEHGALGWAKWYRQENEALWVAKSGPEEDGRRRRGRGDQDSDQDGDKQDCGGWTGWMELPPLPQQPPLPPLPPSPSQPPLPPSPSQAPLPPTEEKKPRKQGLEDEGTGLSEGEEEEGGGEDGGEAEEGEAEDEDAGVQLTEEELLAQLGLRLDEQLEEMQRQGVPPDILRRWLRTERQRSARDWQPLRPPAPAVFSAAGSSGRGNPRHDGDEASEPDPLRVVSVEELRDGIFPIGDSDLKLDLLLAYLSILGVPLDVHDVQFRYSVVTMANQSSCGDDITSAAYMAAASSSSHSGGVGCCSQAFLRLLPPQTAMAVCQRRLPGPVPWVAAAGGPNAAWLPWCLQHESRRAFVAALLRVLLSRGPPFADQPQLCLAYLLLEASRASDPDGRGTDPDSALHPPPPSPLACADRARQAGRALLSEQRNSLAALMALAALEDAAGQPRAARRIRDAALAGASALPPQQQRLLPLLVHQYVETERTAAVAQATAIANGTSDGSSATSAAVLDHCLRAHHVLRWFLATGLTAAGGAGAAGGGGGGGAAGLGGGGGGGGTSYVPYKAGVTVTREDVAAARRGFEARVPGLLATQGGALDAPSASCLFLGGFFEVLTASLFPAGGGGLAAALTIYKHTTAAVPVAVRQSSGYHEALSVSYCDLVVSELEAMAAGHSSGGGLQPARARMLLLQALELYPHNPMLLALRLRLGAVTRSRCALRRDLGSLAAGVMKAAVATLEGLAREAEPAGHATKGPDAAAACSAAAAVWWAQIAAEAGVSYTSSRVNRLLERAASVRPLALCPLVWGAYLGHEAAAGRLPAAKRVFLRAVREVPLSKDLWMQGLATLGCGGDGGGSRVRREVGAEGQQSGGPAGAAPAAAAGLLSSREVSELLGVAAEKGVRLRTDVYEVMLEALAEQQ